MRALATIDAEISATAEKLAALRREREESRQSRDRHVVAMFDARKSAPEIAAALGLPQSKVRNILSEHGRTIRGREAIRAYQASLSDGRQGARP